MTTTYSEDVTIGREPFIPAWMFEAGLTAQEGWVLAYLWRCRNSRTHQCNPSASNIAKKTGISVRKVFSCIKSLKDKRLISIQSGDQSNSNRYVLNVHKVQGVMHHMHTKVLKEGNTNNNILHMHSVHNLPKAENLGVLRSGELHSRFLSVLKPTLSPNAYRDYRVEVLGDGFATVIDLYGSRMRKEISA